MNKTLKIIMIVLVAIVILFFVLWKVLSSRPAAPDKYTEKVQTGGAIEGKYISMGAHEVKYLEAIALDSFKKYELWYPADMNEKTPAVIFANGSGVKASKYPSVLKHLASYGFIVIGTEEEHSWFGFSSEMCFRFLEKINSTEKMDNWKENPFYGKVDLDNVGISGHSQGGVAVFNAITTMEHADQYKCAFAASPTNKELAHTLMWDYDVSGIDIPIFIVSSTGKTDEGFVVSGEQLKDIYDDMAGTPFKAIARHTNVNHGDMLYSADGYMTAFFMWQLKGDTAAAKAFQGENAEILSNPLYIDQQIN